jgi:hypothetical protein
MIEIKELKESELLNYAQYLDLVTEQLYEIFQTKAKYGVPFSQFRTLVTCKPVSLRRSIIHYRDCLIRIRDYMNSHETISSINELKQ